MTARSVSDGGGVGGGMYGSRLLRWGARCDQSSSAVALSEAALGSRQSALLQMPPSMRGGDRRWRGRMSFEDVDFEGDGESTDGQSSEMTTGAAAEAKRRSALVDFDLFISI